MFWSLRYLMLEHDLMAAHRKVPAMITSSSISSASKFDVMIPEKFPSSMVSFFRNLQQLILLIAASLPFFFFNTDLLVSWTDRCRFEIKIESWDSFQKCLQTREIFLRMVPVDKNPKIFNQTSSGIVFTSRSWTGGLIWPSEPCWFLHWNLWILFQWAFWHSLSQ